MIQSLRKKDSISMSLTSGFGALQKLCNGRVCMMGPRGRLGCAWVVAAGAPGDLYSLVLVVMVCAQVDLGSSLVAEGRQFKMYLLFS